MKQESPCFSCGECQEELKTYNEPEAKNLVLVLERYVTGGMDIFSKDTNVDIHNRLVCFDLHNLTASMQTTGYLVVLEHIILTLLMIITTIPILALASADINLGVQDNNANIDIGVLLKN